jgi:sporulation protein YlmC with PRC-barrel domain
MRPLALSASTLTGDKVRNSEGDNLGHLEEIVIDLEGGRVSYAVLAGGGFLGMGDKFFAIPWDLLTVDTDNKEIVVDISKESLKNAPGFDKDNWPKTDDRAWVGDVYRYYGREPYWEVESTFDDRN